MDKEQGGPTPDQINEEKELTALEVKALVMKAEDEKNPSKSLTPKEFLEYILKNEEWLEEDEPGACDMKGGVMHSYNMYQSTMYPEILKNLKEMLIAPNEIMKKLHKEETVKDDTVMKEVTK